MTTSNSNATDLKFSNQEITRQVEKMLIDYHFAHSGIMRKFLWFITTETIEGRSNCLKEYTIAVNVLKKPKTFRPKDNCIVRIHAVRLRKTLVDYYNGPGAMDPIRITLPRGNYVPIFTDNMYYVLNSVLNHQPALQSEACIDCPCMTTAVIPFHYYDRRQMIRNFSDGLGIQLSSALMKIKSLAVISYSITRHVPDKFNDAKELGHLFHAEYLFTGAVQCQKNSIRVTVEMIKADTFEQVWCQTFDRRVTEANIFKIQDEIINLVIKGIQQQSKLLAEKRNVALIMAVA
jgi:TolB-like protein